MEKDTGQYTTPEQRFFFDANRSTVLYHESFNLNPRPTVYGVLDHNYALITRNADGTLCEHPSRTVNPPYNINGGEVITEVVAREPWRIRERAGEYLGHRFESNERIIVEADYDFWNNSGEKAQTSTCIPSVFSFDASVALPSVERLGLPEIHYRFLGYVTGHFDELVVIGTAYTQRLQWLVDLCIAKTLAQGVLEKELLDRAVKLEGSLEGAVNNCPVVYQYLYDWDAKYGTSYHPERSISTSTSPLTIEEQRCLDELDRLIEKGRGEERAEGDSSRKHSWLGWLVTRLRR